MFSSVTDLPDGHSTPDLRPPALRHRSGRATGSAVGASLRWWAATAPTLGAAVAISLLAACTQSLPPASVESQRPASAGLEGCPDREPSFGSCEGSDTSAGEEQDDVDPFECARLEVPLSDDDSEGETMQIAVLRLGLVRWSVELGSC